MRRYAALILFIALFVIAAGAQIRMPYERMALPNGVDPYRLVKKDVPLVSLRLLIKGGAESEPAAKAGLADITNELLLRGTKERTADKIALDLDFLGAAISTSSSGSANRIDLEVLSKDAREGVAILADLALHPTFPADEVRKELARAIDAAKARKDSPQSAIAAYANKFFYEGTGYPGGLVPDEISLARITRDDIVNYHRHSYVGANLVVIVVGDFDPATLKSEITKAFGSVPAGEPYVWKKLKPLRRPSKARALLVDDSGSTQTFLRIMQPGISRTSPDRIPLLLVNTLFGGRFTSMLNDELRVNAGITYGASSLLEQNRQQGSISIATSTATATTREALDLALRVLEKLRTQGITAEQLASAKAYIKGTAPTSLVETSDELASVLTTFAIEGLNESEINDFFTRIDAVTLEDTRRIIDTYYRTDGLTYVLLGARDAMESAMSRRDADIREVKLSAPGIRVDAKPSR
ncbi:MAG: insulinase family protein [Bryobacterales bacterium]|nr:insulinase family protein [Bryobacterales bacterium]